MNMMNITRFLFLIFVAAGFVLVPQSPVDAQQCIPLFNGTSLDGWTTLDGKPVTKGWEVVDGVLHLNVARGRAGDIVTDREYGDFILCFEWKIAPGGNNGVKYRVRKYGKRTLGCEYQMIDDDGYKVKLPPTGSTGALYDLYEPSPAKVLNPVGQFNRSRIVVCGNRIEHWLNGRLIVVAHVGSAEWQRRVAASKFAKVPGFGENHDGRIMLTDHNSDVWYRSIELTPLHVVQHGSQVAVRGRRRGIFKRLLRRRH